jgi:hypothetical protein
MMSENRKPLIAITAILLIAVFLSSLWMSGIIHIGTTSPEESSVNVSHNFIDMNTSPLNLPPEVKENIEKVSDDYHFSLNKWEFDPTKKEIIILYVFDIRNESSIEKIQGMQIKNFTLTIIHDTEFETTKQEVRDYLWNLRKNPDYQINSISMVTDRINDPPVNNAEVWVYRSTLENMKLDKTIMKGWMISVYTVSSPPQTTKIPKINSSDNS